MFEKLKKLLGYGEGFHKTVRNGEWTISAREVKGSNKGSEVIALSLNMLINEMKKKYPEWDGLFDVTTNNGHVIVSCIKGFDDDSTREAIPCLWRRKSFIENCRMFGVPRIVFMDSKNQTCNILRIEDIDISELP